MIEATGIVTDGTSVGGSPKKSRLLGSNVEPPWSRWRSLLDTPSLTDAVTSRPVHEDDHQARKLCGQDLQAGNRCQGCYQAVDYPFGSNTGRYQPGDGSLIWDANLGEADRPLCEETRPTWRECPFTVQSSVGSMHWGNASQGGIHAWICNIDTREQWHGTTDSDQVDSVKFPSKTKHRFYLQFQGKQSTPKEYLEQFLNHVDVLAHVGAVIGPEASIVPEIAGFDTTTGNLNAATDEHQNDGKD